MVPAVTKVIYDDNVANFFEVDAKYEEGDPKLGLVLQALKMFKKQVYRFFLFPLVHTVVDLLSYFFCMPIEKRK